MTRHLLVAAGLASMLACAPGEQPLSAPEPPAPAQPALEQPVVDAVAPDLGEGYTLDPKRSNVPSKRVLERLAARPQPRFPGFQQCKLHIDCTIVRYGFDGCAVRLASIAVVQERAFMAKHAGDTGKGCRTRELSVPSAAPVARCVDAQCAIAWSDTSYFHISDY